MGQGRVLLLTTVHQFLGINFLITMGLNLSERAHKCVLHDPQTQAKIYKCNDL